ncbi:MAG: sulfatase-like hydrolase/transferase [Afipia sp.]|nr:sulfatase-like hydrolase/transferase [Afipia sp.]
MRLDRTSHTSGVARAIIALKLCSIFAFVAVTNPNALTWPSQYIEQGRWLTLVVYLGLWACALTALLIAAFQVNPWVRSFWAVIIALSSAAGFAFYLVSGVEISMFDIASLWAARHEVGRALEFYGSAMAWSALVFLFGFIVIAAPSVKPGAHLRRLLRYLAWAPAFPIALFAAVIYAKDGGGHYGMSMQFAPLSVAAISGARLATKAMPTRERVTWSADGRKIRHVVLLVDESVRGDYIDWRPGNPYTPDIASLKDRIVNFGHAVSGGNCSSYSNAMLRFGATRHDLMNSVARNPTIWDYAKTAGFRTVMIDSQAAFLRGPAKLQNFMTPEEKREIDSFNAIEETIAPPDLDDRLVDILAAKLKSEQPTFVYAIKNGAHFPYDRGYPSTQRIFQPTMSESARGNEPALINSYRNAVQWSVDRVLKRLANSVPLDNTLIIYTSDHGQNLSTTALSHCSVKNADPREALVPLFAMTDEPRLRERLSAGAKTNWGYASHFSIAPTLLDVFGFKPQDIATKYGPSLFEKPDPETEFTSGDIFGLISEKIHWNKIDLSRSYLEQGAKTTVSDSSALPKNQ